MVGIAHSPDDDPTPSPRSRSDEVEDQIAKTPRVFVVAAAALAMVASVASFSCGHTDAGVFSASLGLLAIGGGLSWLSMERRRVREAERQLVASHRAAAGSSRDGSA